MLQTPDEFGGGVSTEGACSSSITGIPVPFLITGFVKNPAILTYYAVKAEAKYTGLFFPFTKTGGLTLKAYAAAKPFGGRIGPSLFRIDKNAIKSRTIDPLRSAAYVGGMQTSSPGFVPGMPIPFPSASFNVYVSNEDDIIGGTPLETNPTDIKFATPNLIYDVSGDMGTHNIAKVFIVPEKNTNPADVPTGNINNVLNNSAIGLYDHAQFKAFKSNFFGRSTTQIESSIVKLKTPTKYEALNYLIPSAIGGVGDEGEKIDTVHSPH